MSGNYYWKWVLVVILVAWAITEIYPPTDRGLLKQFQADAINTDTNFTQIVERAQELQQQYPDREFSNLREAVGTESITNYFAFDVSGQKDPNLAILQRLQQRAEGEIKLGLDLQGGVSFLVALDTSNLEEDQDREAVISQAVQVLRKRVDQMGVNEPLIQPTGNNRIMIQLPGLTEMEKESAKTRIKKAAHLEFRLVHTNSQELISKNIPAPGYERLKMEQETPDGRQTISEFLVQKKPVQGLTGKYVDNARVIRHQISNEPQIELNFNSEGAKIFRDVTQQHQGELLGIVLDGELYSAPRINEPIPTGRATISGDFSIREAFELANILENPLQAPLRIEEERSVDPSLGRDSIQSGINASIIGLIFVAVFMIVYYMLAGVISVVALMLNLLLLLGVLCQLDATLTLPGIAGVVLTIGMAVDANVLIFERIREELANGKSLRGALSAGYDKAFSTIFDANLTTLIASSILIFMGTGPVKGFGVTLTIGIAVSMFTSLVVTRLIFDYLLEKGWIRSIPMLQLIRGTRIDFMKWWRPAFVVSWIVILIGICYGFYRGTDTMGVDFLGGDSITFNYSQQVGVDELRDAVSSVEGVGEAQIQYQSSLAEGSESLLVTVPFDTSEQVIAQLESAFPQAEFDALKVDKVGPTIGNQILQTAIVAMLLALFGALVYVAFRYDTAFAVGAVVAVVHDLLMTLGVFFLVGGIPSFGYELNATVVAALLTIVGFSLNDTIVIFDRIREDLKLGIRGTFKEVINHALNKTLARTLITSGTMLVATLALYLVGGGVINAFSFTFLVGILVGTYSSIFIASALVLWWHKGERPKTSSQMVTEGTTAATARA